MLALYGCGRQAEALETYRDVRQVLIAQFGVEPGPELRRLHDAVLQQEVAIAPRDAPGPSRELAGAAPGAHRARRVRFNVPLAAAHFAGRSAELDAIDEALGVADRAVVTQAITGVGGVGKSLLAARYVQQHAHEYDIVAWIRAEDGGVTDLSELAAALGLPVRPMTPAERAAATVRWLGGCDERWLLVLDNVVAPEQLRDCCPSPGNGRVIVTTRDCGISQFGPVLRLDVFQEQISVEYLLARAERGADRDGATRLARALGGLPLALSHAGAYCAAGTSFDDYLELLRALPAADLFDSHPEVSYAQTVASTWQASMQVAEREAALAREVLAMAAYLAPDAIPRELFDVLLDDATDAATRKRLLDAFNALHRLSLAEVHDTEVSVHRLLQKIIRDDPVLSADETGHTHALAAVAAAFPDNHNQPQTWPQSERLLPHVIAIAATRDTLDEAGQRLVTLLNTATDYLLRADPGPRAVDMATRASTSAQRILGPEHPETLRAHANLAGCYREAGRITEAIELGEQVVADCQRILGPKHPGTLRARGSLVVSYREAGRITEAIELGERVVADCQRILGPEHHNTLSASMILGFCYVDAGRTTDALELGQRVVADSHRVLGPMHPTTLSAGVILAGSYGNAGRITEAIAVGERVLADSERVLGPEHPGTLRARGSLAISYEQAGRTAEAIDLCERVLADSERVLGPEHPGTSRARGRLAISRERARRAAEANDLGKRALAQQRAGPSADAR
jgi:tetratricopeptide (TPR) repeat protein